MLADQSFWPIHDSSLESLPVENFNTLAIDANRLDSADKCIISHEQGWINFFFNVILTKDVFISPGS